MRSLDNLSFVVVVVVVVVVVSCLYLVFSREWGSCLDSKLVSLGRYHYY